MDDVVRHYTEVDDEQHRLATGVGVLERARTLEILGRFLPPPPARILDVGGGPGAYAVALAAQGYAVHLVDLVPLHVHQAVGAAAAAGVPLAAAEAGDARALALADRAVDAVLLLGPLYHLQERADRIRAWSEAGRVVRPGGVVVGAAISRFASALDALLRDRRTDPAFVATIVHDLATGCHRNPTGDPRYFTTAYFHYPDELAGEIAEAGLIPATTLAVEGPAGLLSDLPARWADPGQRARTLDAVREIEAAPALLAASFHLLAVARSPR